MAHSFGDVVLVPFPFAGQSSVNKRLAVIVSGSTYNSGRRDTRAAREDLHHLFT